MDNKLYFGACYYPEQWDSSRWETDVNLMQEAGINIVRLMDLSWSVIEPRDNEFDFSVFDRVLDLLQERGMKAILCTPTMVPPMWMWKKHPDIFADYPDEIEQSDEIRSRVCFNNPVFRQYSRRITEQMALHYAHHPAVAAWQIDNETNANKCCCPHCAAAFRSWLRNKYGTLEQLNRDWGNVFWSMIYDSWDQVAPPSMKRELTYSVSQELDYRRFTSDSAISFLREQIAILRRICPDHQLTHNGMTLFTNLDYFELGQDLDFYGIDIYPAVDFNYARYGLASDFSRGVTRKPYFVMEQKNGYFNYSNYNLAIPPKWVSMWTVKDIAHGANGVVYFRWRSGRYGTEQHPQGLLRHDGSPRRAYYEVQNLTRQLAACSSELAATKIHAKVAMLWSFDSLWALNTHVQNSRFRYIDHFLQYYKVFLENGVTVDIIRETENLDGYDIVVAPTLFVGKPVVAEHLKAFAEQGGTVLLTVRSGIRTDANTTVLESWPGVFRELAGIYVEEFDSLPAYMNNSICYRGQDYPVGCFLDIVHTETAEPAAVYREKFYQGSPALTRHKVGAGQVYYSCVMDCPEFFQTFLTDLCRECGISTVSCPEGVEIMQRTGPDCIYTFVINNGTQSHTLCLNSPALDILYQTEYAGPISLAEYDVRIFRSRTPLSLSFASE